MSAFSSADQGSRHPTALSRTPSNRWGRIDIIVNDVGYSLDAATHKMSDEWLQRMLHIHLVVPFRVVRAAAPHYASRPNASAPKAWKSSAGSSMSCRSAAPWETLARPTMQPARPGSSARLCPRQRMGQFGVNVNAVAFASIDTRMIAEKTPDNAFELDGVQVHFGGPAELRACT